MKGRIRRFLLAVLLALAAGAGSPATAQFFRMQYTNATGWTTEDTQVACTNKNGFLHWPSHTTSWKLNTAGSGGSLNLDTAVANAMAAG